MEFLNICPLCGSEKIKDYYEGVDMYFSHQRINLMSCERCSLILLNPRPNQEEYKKMYETIFQDKRRHLETFGQAVERIIKKKRYEAKIKELKFFRDYINPSDSCLEIGGGWGSLAKVLEDNIGCRIKVIEPSLLAAQVAKEYYKLDVFVGDFDEYIKQERNEVKFDFIYGYHVFEHIAEPNIFLKGIKKLLNKDGKILLAVPNALNPECSSEFFYHIEHCFYYTPKTLALMLNKYGFEIIKIWLDKKDMKVLYQRTNDNTEINFINNEVDLVRRKQNILDTRYKFYRNIKKVFFYFLDDKQKDKINNLIMKILKR